VVKPLDGKVAIVTGASRGIGRAIAERLARDGASVVVNYARSKDEADAVVAAIGAERAVAVQADVADVAAVRRLFAAARERFGRVDILVNNAAVVMVKPIAEITPEEYDAVFAANVKGPLFAMQEAARTLPDGGRVVTISTGATKLGLPGLALYGGSKAALEQITLVLANELAPRGITVNTVAAGPTETRMLDEYFAANPGAREMMQARSPQGRFGQPRDIADVVAFLVSDDARWVTGQWIGVAGGAG
jgi:3-oxoacyl-[acyl-carrier protein] reductase